MIKKEYVSVIFKLHEALEETKKIQCNCNKYTDYTCRRCILIESIKLNIECCEQIGVEGVL